MANISACWNKVRGREAEVYIMVSLLKLKSRVSVLNLVRQHG